MEEIPGWEHLARPFWSLSTWRGPRLGKAGRGQWSEAPSTRSVTSAIYYFDDIAFRSYYFDITFDNLPSGNITSDHLTAFGLSLPWLSMKVVCSSLSNANRASCHLKIHKLFCFSHIYFLQCQTHFQKQVMSDCAEVFTWSKVTLGSWDFPVGKSSTTRWGSPAMFTKLYSPLLVSNWHFCSRVFDHLVPKQRASPAQATERGTSGTVMSSCSLWNFLFFQ